MVTVQNDKIWRGETNIGYLSGHKLFDETGKEMGYYENGRIYHADGREAGYIEGDHIYYADGTKFGRADDNFERVAQSDSYYPPLCAAAISILFGD